MIMRKKELLLYCSQDLKRYNFKQKNIDQQTYILMMKFIKTNSLRSQNSGYPQGKNRCMTRRSHRAGDFQDTRNVMYNLDTDYKGGFTL